MIDNDITTDTNKDFEFYNQGIEDGNNLLGINDDDEEWEI
jgi:hypothetical protein